MYTEISKIIEGGLSGDREKVYNYAKVLADNLEETGEKSLSKKIYRIINNRKSGMLALDSLSSKPVDSESRMDIVDISYPDIDIDSLVLNKNTENEIEDFIKCYKSRDKLIAAGIDETNTLLLYGPPGCGKTTVAKYISMKTGLPLITARLDGLISSLLGSTAKNIRKIFDFASRQECILFLDEFDAIAKARDDQREIGELKRVINSLLQNIDFMPKHCVLMAATNHPELLDRAVWRRFIQKVEVSLPSKESLKELIQNLSSPYTFDFGGATIKGDTLLNLFIGLSPSDLKTLFERAKIKCVLENQSQLDIVQLLLGTFELLDEEKSEKEFIRFLNSKGVAQRHINKLTGISLRQIKNYLKPDANG